MFFNPIATAKSQLRRTVLLPMAVVCLSVLTIAPAITADPWEAENASAARLIQAKANRVEALISSGTTTNEWILQNYPDSVREKHELGIQADAGVIDLPVEISTLYFTHGIDPALPESYTLHNVVDSLVHNGQVVPGDENALSGVYVDSSVLHDLYVAQMTRLSRQIPGAAPGETSTSWSGGEMKTTDLSTFYSIGLDTLADVDAARVQLEGSPSLLDAYYIGIPIPFGESSPEHSACPINETLLEDQWYLRGFSCDTGVAGMDALGAWPHICDQVRSTRKGATIAIFDEQFSPTTHPDLLSNLDPRSRVGANKLASYHGNNVAGLCAASVGSQRRSAANTDPSMELGIGIAGVAPQSNLVLMDYKDGTDYVADIKYVLDNCPDVRIMNFSWAVLFPHPALKALLEEAYYKRGVVLTAAVGDGNSFHPAPFVGYPGAYPWVIAVTGSEKDCRRLSRANFGYVDITAPGDELITTDVAVIDTSHFGHPAPLYAEVSGTSFSCALVTGVASLAHTTQPGLSAATIRTIMSRTANQLEGFEAGYDEYTGWGVVSASGIVSYLAGGLYCEGRAGDLDNDCYINDGDLIRLLDFTFYGGLPVDTVSADVNGDCLINVSDGIYMVDYLYRDGPPPVMGCSDTDGSSTPGEDQATLTVGQNYPNPFNPSTTIAFSLDQPTHVTVTVYNVLGREVRTLLDAQRDVGDHQVVWEGSNTSGQPVASGVYLYRIQAGDAVHTSRMLLMK